MKTILPKRKSRTEIAKEAFKMLPDDIHKFNNFIKQKIKLYTNKITDDKYHPILEDNNYDKTELQNPFLTN